MYCDQCGSIISEDASFCASCGSKIQVAGASTSPITTAQNLTQSNELQLPKVKKPVKYSILAIVVVLVAGILGFTLKSASREDHWIWVTTADDGSVYYYDKNSIERNSGVVTMRILGDYVESPNDILKNYYSSAATYDYDCENGRARLYGTTQYSGQMGKGKVIYSSSGVNKTGWSFVRPDSVIGAELNFACQAI